MSRTGIFGLFLVLVVPSLALAWTNAIAKKHGVMFEDDASRGLVGAAAVQEAKECGVALLPPCVEQVEERAAFALDNYVANFRELYPKKRELTSADLAGFNVTMSNYGRLVLGSQPSEAKVYLKENLEGETTVERVYPVDTYTFSLKKPGCTDSSVTLEIKKNKTTKRTVRLQCG